MPEPATPNGRSWLAAIWDRWAPAFMIGVAVIGGYWLLIERVLDGIDANIATLRAETGQRFAGTEVQDRDIRAVIQSTNDALRADMGKLGDRIVQSNLENGTKIDKMRDDVIKAMQEGDARLEDRFDRLDEKFDALLTRIDYDVIEIPPGQLPLTVDKEGLLLSPDGKQLVTLPAVLKFE
jgi:hypothetical protein